MHFVRFRKDQKEPCYGIQESDSQILPIHGHIFGKWIRGRQHVRLYDVLLLAPVEPPVVIGIGYNYQAHTVEADQQISTVPNFFQASPTVIGPNQPIVLPSIAPDKVDYEAELRCDRKEGTRCF